jgi:hypothetical protein
LFLKQRHRFGRNSHSSDPGMLREVDFAPFELI